MKRRRFLARATLKFLVAAVERAVQDALPALRKLFA